MQETVLRAFQIMYTIIALLSIAFGVSNIVMFRQYIVKQHTLSLFYIFAIACLVTTLMPCWLNVEHWNDIMWLLSCGLVRTFEVSFAWCQTLAFLQLCQRLSASLDERLKTDTALEAENRKWTRINHATLALGLLLFNSIFVVYFYVVFTLSKNPDDNTAKQKDQFVKMEIVCWAAGVLSSVILITAIAYTAYILNLMYPGQGAFPERNRIMYIALIFSISITTKSLFEWVMYYKHLQGDSPAVMNLLRVQEIFMPYLWDIVPICAIFYLHLLNFKRVCINVEDVDFRTSETSQIDNYSVDEMDQDISHQEKKSIYLKFTQERLRQLSRANLMVEVRRSDTHVMSNTQLASDEQRATWQTTENGPSQKQTVVNSSSRDPSMCYESQFLGILDTRRTICAIKQRYSVIAAPPNGLVYTKKTTLLSENHAEQDDIQSIRPSSGRDE